MFHTHTRIIPEDQRKEEVLQPGVYNIEGLLVRIVEPTKIIRVQEAYQPEYMTKYKPISHSWGGRAEFSKFRT